MLRRACLKVQGRGRSPRPVVVGAEAEAEAKEGADAKCRTRGSQGRRRFHAEREKVVVAEGAKTAAEAASGARWRHQRKLGKAQKTERECRRDLGSVPPGRSRSRGQGSLQPPGSSVAECLRPSPPVGPTIASNPSADDVQIGNKMVIRFGAVCGRGRREVGPRLGRTGRSRESSGGQGGSPTGSEVEGDGEELGVAVHGDQG